MLLYRRAPHTRQKYNCDLHCGMSDGASRRLKKGIKHVFAQGLDNQPAVGER